ncbi:MAG: hypothetical protein MZV63_15285 [Marinilabiliales bacterium]|nr:hypothetical protein [Marinilabiliales bacterium]
MAFENTQRSFSRGLHCICQTGNISDGEEMMLPILTNKSLVVESMTMLVRGKEYRTFEMKRMTENTSDTVKHDNSVLEFTANPSWYAIEALPYLIGIILMVAWSRPLASITPISLRCTF